MRHAALPMVLLSVIVPLVGGADDPRRFPPDPVEGLRRVLTEDFKVMASQVSNDGTRISLEEAAKVYRGQMTKAIAAFDRATLSEISRAILLLEWKPKPRADASKLDIEVADIEGPKRRALLSQFVKGVGVGLEKSTPARQVAICNLISETLVGFDDPVTRDELGKDEKAVEKLAVSLRDLAGSSAPADVRAAAARSLSRFFLFAETARDGWAKMLAPDQPEPIRRAAAEAMEAMIAATSGAEPLPPSEPGVTTRDRPSAKAAFRGLELARLAAVLSPLAWKGAADESTPVRYASVRALREAATAMDETAKGVADLLKRAQGEKFSEILSDNIIYTLDTAESLDKATMVYVEQANVMRSRILDEDASTRTEARRMVQSLARLKRELVDLDEVLSSFRRILGEQFPKRGPKPPLKKKDPDKDAVRIIPTAFQAKDDLPAPVRKKLDFVPSVEALERMLDELARSLVGQGANDPDVRSRRAGAEAIEALGPLGKPFIPSLARMLKDEDIFVRWIAARALGRLGEVAASATPELILVADDDDLDVRIAALLALGKIGPDASAAIPTLTRRLTLGDAEARLAAIKALEGIGRATSPALPTLVGLFTHEDARIRRDAATLVGKFGTEAREYIPQLRRLVDDRDAGVRRAASSAILAIDS